MTEMTNLPSCEDDWDKWRDTITDLYMTQNETCDSVIKIMRERYDFVASEKPYKTHFSKWKLFKNFRRNEAQLIASGELPSSLRMQSLDAEKLRLKAVKSSRRSQARFKALNDPQNVSRVSKPASSRPLSLTIVPQPPPSSSPHITSPLLVTPSIKSVELLLLRLRLFTHEAFVNGHWSTESAGKNSVGRGALRMLSLDLTAGSKYFEEGKIQKANQLWYRALKRAGKPDLLVTWYYETPLALLFELGRLVHGGQNELAAQLIRIIAAQAKVFLGDKDPRRALFSVFEELDIPQLRDVYERAAHSLREGLETRVEKHNPLLYQIKLHRALDLVWFDPKTDLRKWVPPIEEIDRALGPNNPLTVYFLLLDAYRLVASNSYIEADEVCKQVSNRLDILKQIPGQIDMSKIGMAYRRLGRQYYEQNRHDDARRTLNQALMYIDKNKHAVLVEIYHTQEKLAALANDAADVELWQDKLHQMEESFVDTEPEEIVSPLPLGSFDEGMMSDGWPSPTGFFQQGLGNFTQQMYPTIQAHSPMDYGQSSSTMSVYGRSSSFLGYEDQGPRFTNEPELMQEPTYGAQLASGTVAGTINPTMTFMHSNPIRLSNLSPDPMNIMG